MKNLAILLLLSVPLIACTMPVNQDKDNLTGASWELVKKIEVRPRHKTVYIQDGEVVTSGWKGNEYQPHCAVELKTFSKDRRSIKPDRFEIIKVNYDSKAITETNSRYSINMTVKSLQQPDISQINCHHVDDHTADFISIADMQKTMQGLFTLHLPEKSGK